MVRTQTEPNMKQSRRPSPIRRVHVDRFYALARERYAALGMDAERALKTLASIPISL